MMLRQRLRMARRSRRGDRYGGNAGTISRSQQESSESVRICGGLSPDLTNLSEKHVIGGRGFEHVRDVAGETHLHEVGPQIGQIIRRNRTGVVIELFPPHGTHGSRVSEIV